MDMNLPKGMLVMLIKRGNEFMIPNGSLQLHAGDKLLIISESKRNKKFAHVPTCCAMVPHGNWHMGKFAHYSTEQQHDIQCGDNHRNGIKHE
mgnify:FL=1